MPHAVSVQRPPGRCAGFVTAGTMVAAALSAVVLMSGCHTAPGLAIAATGAPGLTAVGDDALPAMPPLQPFDEHFYTPPADGDSTQD